MQKSYDPKSFEENIYNDWLVKGYFKAAPNKDKKPFTVMMPPPNITGQLHMGHALNNTIQDSLIRYKRMKGFEALWLPGTDHASIATEVKITERLNARGVGKKDIGREGFIAEAFKWNDEFGGRIVEQLKRLGCSCDWDKQAFTMDARCSKAVREVFVRLYEKGLVYRGNRIINWCPQCKTALSDEEVDHKENNSSLWYIKYPVEGSKGEFMAVATTRPETMLGDVAVAVNPEDKRYKGFIGRFLSLPLTNRKIPVIADGFVDVSFGTGAVKITPAHDPNDFEAGLRHNLTPIAVMNEGGVMNENAGAYNGLDRFAARKKVLEDLERSGLLQKTESRKNNVGHCYRCGTVIEPSISKQWFVSMKPLAGPAVDAVKNGSVKFMPKRFEKIYLHWMNSVRDWCVSRQLWWGHRIPAFYCESCDYTGVLREDITVCPKCGGRVKQDEDVFDTWFSSALWPFSTLGWPDKTPDLDYFYPTDVLVTAYDIIFFWVARMIFSGLEHTGEKPFSTVFINGLVRDENGRKMSKSLKNGVDPLELIDAYGTDALRFSLLNGTAPGGDQRFLPAKLEGYRNFMNKIYNAAKFVLMNAGGERTADPYTIKSLSLADKWILTKLSETAAAVTKNMDRYEAGAAAGKLYDFTWNVFCDYYIELSKAELNSGDLNAVSAAKSTLCYVLRELLKMLHPFIPFITEKIFLELPNKDAESIMLSSFPVAGKKFGAEFKKTEEIITLVKAVRALRAEKGVPQSKKITLHIVPKPEFRPAFERTGYLERLCGISKLEFYAPAVPSTELLTPSAAAYIPAGELADVSSEKQRLDKELKACVFEFELASKKLRNEGFLSKAPKALIEAEEEKVKKYKALIDGLTESINKLAGLS
jgi:valyl-tRNA synthetase